MIQLEEVTIRSGVFVLRGVSLAVAQGQYGVLMGRTGCGKTTLLEAICGLRPVEAGSILLDGRDVTRLRPAERGIGYVPQDSALFATMTVRDQLAYALSLRRWDGRRIAERVAELAALLDIGPLVDRYPQGLSGGETRRVALGRALASYPNTLLLDEPLSGLDDATRDKMIELLKHVQRTTGVTLLHVTHSQDDATRLADRRFTLEDGVLLEPATER
jgi:ABC-type sugar transport system ATPase subunit